ncbi:MAG: Mut7-C RNAse domain-containing protein [Nitrospirota bacterium]
MMFIADVMLGSLAKRLRLLGFDVLYDPAYRNNDVLRLALDQGRIILTRDTALASRPLAINHILIGSDLVDEQLHQVLKAFPPPDGGQLTRCSICNEQLSVLDRKDARDLVPDHVVATVTEFWRCGHCGKVYWKGSHVRNMRGSRTK